MFHVERSRGPGRLQLSDNTPPRCMFHVEHPSAVRAPLMRTFHVEHLFEETLEMFPMQRSSASGTRADAPFHVERPAAGRAQLGPPFHVEHSSASGTWADAMFHVEP